MYKAHGHEYQIHKIIMSHPHSYIILLPGFIKVVGLFWIFYIICIPIQFMILATCCTMAAGTKSQYLVAQFILNLWLLVQIKSNFQLV